jgi:hypothetical protein
VEKSKKFSTWENGGLQGSHRGPGAGALASAVQRILSLYIISFSSAFRVPASVSSYRPRWCPFAAREIRAFGGDEALLARQAVH